MTNLEPTSRHEPTPNGDDLREFLNLVDEAVGGITDADVEADLAAVLGKAGYDAGIVRPEVRLGDFRVARLTDPLRDLPGWRRDRFVVSRHAG